MVRRYAPRWWRDSSGISTLSDRESRITIDATTPQGESFHVNLDNAKKVVAFDKQSHIGVVTYGLAAIGLRTAQSFVPEFEASLPGPVFAGDGTLISDRMKVHDFAVELSDFFMARWQEWQAEAPEPYQGPPVTLVVAGFNEQEPYGRVFVVDIPSNPEPDQSRSELSWFALTGGAT